ncbi:MFS general substrate transporter [Dichomitus squalens]|uniref:MFS general substrate transporter n=1 Tax=Dichomitus squalens TaxID=114155 RepID=A0A4Q9MP65_9APHY|nr:MFS general substrate transporter [Dichomitus squalens]
MASTEESSLLASSSSSSSADSEILKHDLLYRRFSPSQKRVIVSLIAYAALIPFLASGSFVPSIPEIARELGTTGPIVSLAVSLSLATAALGSLTWATYSGRYGRRYVYVRSLPCFCLGSIGVANSHSVPTLMFWRFVQAFGTSSAMSVGAGVIGDIYRLEERGYAMGIFFGASLLGSTIAPLCGGIATHYASWRYAQWGLFFMGITAFVPVALWLPETLDPEKLDRIKAEGAGFKLLNPFASLALLRSPNIFVLTIAGTAALITDFVMMVPLAYTVGVQYGITNEAIVGALFLPLGLGNIIGAPLAGHMADRAVVSWRKRRGGVWVPEDRLRATFWGAALFVPGSILATGLTMKYVKGIPGICLIIVWLFMNGIGVDIVLTPSSSYYVDILHNRSAETMAASSSFRALIAAFVTAGTLPLIESIGVTATNALFAFIAWLGLGLILLTIRYGDRMRAWQDIGYTTTRDTC